MQPAIDGSLREATIREEDAPDGKHSLFGNHV